MFDLGNEKLNLKEVPHVMESFQQIKWALLFIDLMFVGVIYNTDNILLSCGHEPIVFFVAFCYFALMFNTRNHLDFYASSSICLMRNTSFPLLQNDVFHRLVMVSFGLGIYLSTINISEQINPSDESGDFGNCNFDSHYTMAFSVGFIISRLIIVMWNAVIVFFSPLPAFRDLYFFSFCSRSALAFLTILVMLAPFAAPQNILVSMPIVIAVDLSGDHLRLGLARLWGLESPKDVEIVPLHQASQDSIFCNPEVFLERIGLIFMLVLGEGIIGISFTQYTSESEGTWRSQIFAYLLLVSIAMLFYETVDRVNFDNHALVKGLNYRAAFYLLHLVSSMFLLIGVVGVIELYVEAGNVLPAGFVATDDHATDDNSSARTHAIDVQWNSWLVAVGLSGMEVCLEAMRYLHEPQLMKQTFRCSERQTYLRSMFRLSLLLHLAIYFIAESVDSYASWIITAHALVSLASNCLHVALATVDKDQVIGSEATGNEAEAGSVAGGGKASASNRMSLLLSWDERRSSLLNRLEGLELAGGGAGGLRKSSLQQNPLLRGSTPSSDRNNSRASSSSGAVGRKSSQESLRKGGTTLFSTMSDLKDSLPPIEEETASRSVSTTSELPPTATRYTLMN